MAGWSGAPTAADWGEDRLTAGFARFVRPNESLEVGIGDDAAVTLPGGAKWVWSVDAQVEDVHFRAAWASPAAIGARAFQVAASDVSAMGGAPRVALLSLALPKSAAAQSVLGLVRGFAKAAERAGATLAGGNLAAGKQWALHVTVGGPLAGKALRRDGAKAGDDLWVSGRLGGAAAALRKLLDGSATTASAAWLRPSPPFELGPALAKSRLANAAIDLSDGLDTDLARLLHASQLGACIHASQLPVAPSLRRHAAAEALRFALAGGEAYQLLFTAPRRARARIEALARDLDLRLTRIGFTQAETGMELEDSAGGRRRLRPSGFDHFARRAAVQ